MTSQTRYYHYDGLGSTQLLTDENGNVTDQYCNSAFGEPVETAAENPAVNPFRYVGREGYYLDADTGQYYVRARTYDPPTARFLSADPAESDPNLYRYCGDNPMTCRDPSGVAAVQPGDTTLCYVAMRTGMRELVLEILNDNTKNTGLLNYLTNVGTTLNALINDVQNFVGIKKSVAWVRLQRKWIRCDEKEVFLPIKFYSKGEWGLAWEKFVCPLYCCSFVPNSSNPNVGGTGIDGVPVELKIKNFQLGLSMSPKATLGDINKHCHALGKKPVPPGTSNCGTDTRSVDVTFSLGVSVPGAGKAPPITMTATKYFSCNDCKDQVSNLR